MKALRTLLRGLIFSFAFSSLALLGRLTAGELPEMRPALLKPGRDSLANLIDTARLRRQGQGDAVVHFTCNVTDPGEGHLFTYRSSPGSTLLAREAVRECPHASFNPAVYHHQTVPAQFTGTIVFVANNRPDLRIFLNQEEDHIKKGDDFIAPQEVYLWYASHNSSYYPPLERMNGSARIQIETDATGRVVNATLVKESPTGYHLGDTFMFEMPWYHCTPGYLQGKPVACTTTRQFIYHGSGGQEWSDSK